MNQGVENESGHKKDDWPSLARSFRALAEENKGDPIKILDLLRSLEHLHQELREGVFQESLPDNRQRLYNLLKDIEVKGGWPYIPRMKLRSLIEKCLDPQDPQK